jgi:integrase
LLKISDAGAYTSAGYQEVDMATVIKRNNSPFWYMKFRIGGKQYLLSTKETDHNEAKIMLEKTLLKLRKLYQEEKLTEKVFQVLKGEERRKLSLKDVWPAWVTAPKRRQPALSTQKDHRTFWNRFEKWTQTKKLEYVHQITPQHAKGFMRTIWDLGVTQNRYNKYRNFLRMIWRSISDLAGIDENPWDKVETLAQETKSKRELSEDELKRVISAADKTLFPLFIIGIYTGMRLGDACTLTWDEVDLKANHIIRIENKKQSRGKPINIPIHPNLRVTLVDFSSKRQSEYVMPEIATQYLKRADVITRNIQRLFESCGIQTQESPTGHRKNKITVVGFHSLRHSFVSLCAQKGVPEVALMELVGHGSPAMTRHYSHAGKETKINAIKSLPAFGNHSAKYTDAIREKNQDPLFDKRKSDSQGE